MVFFTENGKQTLWKLSELIEYRRIKSITRHGSFPEGTCPSVLTPQGQEPPSFIECTDFNPSSFSSFGTALPGKVMGFMSKSQASSVHVALAIASSHLQVLWVLKKSEQQEFFNFCDVVYFLSPCALWFCFLCQPNSVTKNSSCRSSSLLVS